MGKNTISILIILGVFLIASFMLVQTSMFSAEKLLATTAQQLEKQIKFLQQQVEDLIAKFSSLKKKEVDTTPPILSNLEPENVTDVSGIITWGSDELSDSKVNYAIKYMRKGVVSGTISATNSALTVYHQVQLTSLKPNTKYYYYVSSTDLHGNTSISNIHSITTLPTNYMVR